MSDTTAPASDGRAVYADAATRLERVIDAQRAALDDIDARAMAVMRLVAALLGVLVSLLSLAATLGGRLPDPSTTALLSLVLGAVALVGTLVAATVTYLGSRVVPGIGPGMTDDVLDAPPTESAHLRRVVTTLSAAVRANRAALAVNARRFRVTLLSLVTGLTYGTYGGIALAFSFDGVGAGLLLVVLTGALAATWWYVLSGHYLTDAALTVPDGAALTTGTGSDPAAYPLAVVERGDRRTGDGE